MNLLSHFYFDGTPNPYYNFGLLVPDLVPAVGLKWRLKDSFRPASKWYDKSVLAGTRKHIYRDAIFHNLPSFFKNTKRMRILLESNGLKQDGTKLFFAAHISYEILMDHLIILKQPSVLEEFYSMFEDIKHEHILNFSNKYLSTKGQAFANFIDSFKEKKYLYQYKDMDGLFASVNRVLVRGKQKPFPLESIGKFKNFATESFNILESDYQSLKRVNKIAA